MVKRPEDAVDVFEFDPVAHSKVPGAQFGFLATGAEDEGSLRDNRNDIANIGIRPRRLGDVTRAVSSCHYIRPAGRGFVLPYLRWSQEVYRREGAIAVAAPRVRRTACTSYRPIQFARSAKLGQSR